MGKPLTSVKLEVPVNVKINSIFWYVLLGSAVIAEIAIIFECFGILIRASGDDTPGGRVG
jgi:hypothetical protein